MITTHRRFASRGDSGRLLDQAVGEGFGGWSLKSKEGWSLSSLNGRAKVGFYMANSKNTGRDRGLVSSEAHEIEYIHQQFPGHSHAEVVSALKAAKTEMKGSESRARMMQILRRKLG